MFYIQKCFRGSCLSGTGSVSNQPFCGTALSEDAMSNSVPIGTCGSCQVNPDGGGMNECNIDAEEREECPLSNSCPTLGTPTNPIQLVCCTSGGCAPDGGVDDDLNPTPGANCS